MRCLILFLVFFACACADPSFVTKKFCKGLDPNQCTIYTVVVDPCAQGPNFCSMKKHKKYGLTLNLSPRFSAQKLKLSISGDVLNDDSFSTAIVEETDACLYLTCPVQAEERRIFDIDMTLGKNVSSKFPVQVKMWNEEDESQACCFTFTVKAK